MMKFVQKITISSLMRLKEFATILIINDNRELRQMKVYRDN